MNKSIMDYTSPSTSLPSETNQPVASTQSLNRFDRQLSSQNYPSSIAELKSHQRSRCIRIEVGSTALPGKVMKFPQKAQSVETSTKPHETSNLLSSKIESIFWTAKGEIFEDGMESVFSRKLNSVVKEYGGDAIEIITLLIVYKRVNPEVAGEALRWLGRMEDSESYKFRRWLLERSLRLPSTRVKDGAILGLASMDDKHAIPYLKRAIREEQCTELRADMEQVLEQLES
jgi:HEAT repeats